MLILNPKSWYKSIPESKIKTKLINFKKNQKMKKLFFWECTFHILGALGAIVSGMVSIFNGSNYGWQLITFFWIITSFIKTLTIKKMES